MTTTAPRGPTPPPTIEQYQAALRELVSLRQQSKGWEDRERIRAEEHRDRMAKFDLARKHLDECRDYYIDKVSAGFRNVLLQSVLFMVLGGALALFFVFSYWIGAHGM